MIMVSDEKLRDSSIIHIMKMLTIRSVVTICHHTKLLQYYALYSLCHTPTPVTKFFSFEVCTSAYSSPISPCTPNHPFSVFMSLCDCRLENSPLFASVSSSVVPISLRLL